ncbi:MAG: MFS transporter [Cyanobacteriota bacterium]|nr:MFS transporter [Cyanobacteriota bacterium]
MRIFLIVWLGQIVSLLGSGLTEFALGVWVYQTTGSISQFALISLCIHLPNIIVSPFAGAIVDRWSRRRAMILSDSVTGVAAIVVLGLVLSDRLEIWHIYVGVIVSAVFNTFQWPAYIAAIAQLVPKENLGRANGMVQVARAVAKILGPIVAGFLLEAIELKGILLVDLCTFVFAISTLLWVRFPKVERTATTSQKVNLDRLWGDIASGWNYIAQRPGLLKLTMFFSISYFSEGMLQVLFWPLVLAIGSESELGMVLSVSGCGMLLGSVAIGAWGGPKRKMYGILGFVALQGLCLCLGGTQATVIGAAFGGFGYLFARPIVASCNQAIWQSKVPFDLQGRVFSLQGALERSLLVFAHLSAGPLVDGFLEPMMADNGLLANSIGRLIGTGSGRGIGLLFLVLGISNIIVTFIAYRSPRLRRIEQELPDASVANLQEATSETVSPDPYSATGVQ